LTTTNITYFITGKYIILDHIMHLVSWNWDFYVSIATDKLGKFYTDQKISPIYNQLMEKILNDIAKSLTLSNFLGYQPIEKDFYSNEIVFINNLTNYHATPCKTTNYLVRFKIKKY